MSFPLQNFVLFHVPKFGVSHHNEQQLDKNYNNTYNTLMENMVSILAMLTVACRHHHSVNISMPSEE